MFLNKRERHVLKYKLFSVFLYIRLLKGKYNSNQPKISYSIATYLWFLQFHGTATNLVFPIYYSLFLYQSLYFEFSSRESCLVYINFHPRCSIFIHFSVLKHSSQQVYYSLTHNISFIVLKEGFIISPFLFQCHFSFSS